MNKELYLSNSDALNYKALVNFLFNIPVLNRKRDNIKDSISNTLRFKIASKQDWKCLDCDKNFYHKNGKVFGSTQEHVIPFKYGGQANENNIILLCEHCNLKRMYIFDINIVEEHYGPIDLRLIESLENRKIVNETV